MMNGGEKNSWSGPVSREADGDERVDTFEEHMAKMGLENPDESVEKIDDLEKERREKIIDNAEKFYERMDAVRELLKYDDEDHPEGRQEVLRRRDLMVKSFYEEQAPLIIKDEKRRKLWMEEIDSWGLDSASQSFDKGDVCAEKCMEALALGEDITKVCEIIKDDFSRAKYKSSLDPQIAFNCIVNIVNYADRGEELADYLGFSKIDWENDDTGTINQLFEEVVRKVGLEVKPGPEELRNHWIEWRRRKMLETKEKLETEVENL